MTHQEYIYNLMLSESKHIDRKYVEARVDVAKADAALVEAKKIDDDNIGINFRTSNLESDITRAGERLEITTAAKTEMDTSMEWFVRNFLKAEEIA